jgi:hypothetical protein
MEKLPKWKVVDLEKLYNFAVYDFFYLKFLCLLYMVLKNK